MINLGINFASSIGILNMIVSILYIIVGISKLIIIIKNTQYSLPIAFKLLEMIFLPLILFASGIILLFNGWRLDPILVFQQLLSSILISFFIIKDNIETRF